MLPHLPSAPTSPSGRSVVTRFSAQASMAAPEPAKAGAASPCASQTLSVPLAPKSLLRSGSKSDVLLKPMSLITMGDSEDAGNRMGSREGALLLAALFWPNGTTRWDPKERRGKCYHCGSGDQVRRNLCVTCRVTSFKTSDACMGPRAPKLTCGGRNPYVASGGYRYCQGNCSTIPRPLAEFSQGDSKKCDWCTARQANASGKTPTKSLLRTASTPKLLSSGAPAPPPTPRRKAAPAGTASAAAAPIALAPKGLKRAASFNAKRKRSTEDASGGIESLLSARYSSSVTSASTGWSGSGVSGDRRESVLVQPPMKRGGPVVPPPAPEPRRGPELYSVPEGEEFSFMNDSFGLNGSFGLDGLARFSDIMPRDSAAPEKCNDSDGENALSSAVGPQDSRTLTRTRSCTQMGGPHVFHLSPPTINTAFPCGPPVSSSSPMSLSLFLSPMSRMRSPTACLDESLQSLQSPMRGLDTLDGFLVEGGEVSLDCFPLYPSGAMLSSGIDL